METQTQPKPIKKDRSTAYPAINLEEAIEKATLLDTAFGKSQFDRESAAKALGYSKINGTSATRFAAILHYGLIDRQGSTYVCSELLKKILRPNSQTDKDEAIVDAAKNPKLFGKLFTEYKGGSLPKLLNNILTNQHGIASKISTNVVDIFQKSMEFAGLYSNGVLKDMAEVSSVDLENNGDDTTNLSPSTLEQNQKSRSAKVIPSAETSTTVLPSGIIISYPTNFAFYLQIDPTFAETLKKLEVLMQTIIATEKEKHEDDRHTTSNTSSTK